jgi:glycerol-3-phosphate dehydrogenase [NAD(P)+]
MSKIAVIGAGTWGTALAVLLSDNKHDVTLCTVFTEEAEALNATRRHKNLPGLTINEDIKITSGLNESTNAEILVLAVPSVYTRGTAKKLKEFYKEGQIIVNVSKGIEESSLKTLDVQIKEEIPGAIVAVLSGPSHAEEVANKLPTTCVVGADNIEVASYIQNVFMSPVFRVYTSPDIIGIEIGAALKNVIALSAGIADGLGYGDNTKAALITRGIKEISELGEKMGGCKQTFYGLSGIGDLIVTCASMHSRNRRAGILIGKGYSLEEACNEVNMVVEGVYSAKAAKSLAEKYGVEMPIVSEVNAVLFDNKSAKEAVDNLMLRQRISEDKALCWDSIE